MSDLKTQLIKLGSTNPELRPHIRKILAAEPNPSRLRELWLVGEADVLLVDNLPVGLEVYTYTSRKGHFAVVAVTSKAKKPFVWENYRSEENRDRRVGEILKNWNDEIVRKRQRKEEKQYKGGLNVGDILYTSWGYDQTNVEFFQVVGVPSPSMVEIRGISGKRASSDRVVADPNSFIGPVLRKRPQGNGDKLYVKLDSVRTAWLWDGKPRYKTPSGMGH